MKILETHGMVGTRLHNIWMGMKNRCYGNGNRSHRYKDRGIIVCPEWANSFLSFKSWADKNDYSDGLQIDRIDNDGNYEPGNCRFVDVITNCNNREITVMVSYNGNSVPLKIILRSLKIENHYHAIYRRIQRGWIAQIAIDTPIRKGNYRRA